MKEQIVANLIAVINALNAVTVCGKNNLGNLGGSIGLLEETVAMLRNAEINVGKETK